MDRLMRQGTTFTHAFIMGGTMPAVCMPSRGMLMTGQTLFHVHDNLVGPNDYPETPKRPYTTFPEMLRKSGYTTFGTGKWHNGESLYARSFSTGENIFFGGMSNHLEVPVADFDPSGKYPKDKRHIGEQFSSNLFTDSAIKFLKNYKDDKPFLMYVAYTAPHDPRMAPKNTPTCTSRSRSRSRRISCPSIPSIMARWKFATRCWPLIRALPKLSAGISPLTTA